MGIESTDWINIQPWIRNKTLHQGGQNIFSDIRQTAMVGLFIYIIGSQHHYVKAARKNQLIFLVVYRVSALHYGMVSSFHLFKNVFRLVFCSHPVYLTPTAGSLSDCLIWCDAQYWLLSTNTFCKHSSSLPVAYLYIDSWFLFLTKTG